MKHGAKNRSHTRKILNNNNVHTHARTHALTCSNQEKNDSLDKVDIAIRLLFDGSGSPKQRLVGWRWWPWNKTILFNLCTHLCVSNEGIQSLL